MADELASELSPMPRRPSSVSILINNFNYGQFLDKAIESALQQTHPAQVIVVDDGSTDDSHAIIQRYSSHVTALFQPNGGQGSAMNAGFVRATGDIVLFLDADDMLHKRVVETLLDQWKPETVMVQYPLFIIDSDGRKVGVYPDPPTSLSQGNVVPELLRTGSFGVNVTSGLAFSRRALATIMPLPGEELRNAADGYLVRAVAFLGPIQRLNKALGYYRRHSTNDSNVCATPGGLADGFRKKIGYAVRELEVTRQFAARHGLSVDERLGEQNADLVGYHLFLSLTDPTSEILAGSRRSELLRRYVSARWKSTWPLKRRLLAVGLATAAYVSPAPLALRFVTWLHDPQSRPEWWRSLAGRLRFMQRSSPLLDADVGRHIH